jgi:hypothetical protein
VITIVRQNIEVNPSRRQFESYLDYSGGRNSEISNENLKDNEYPTLDNVDLLSRGSLKRRTGRGKLLDIGAATQGMFFFFPSTNSNPTLIIASAGKLYYSNYNSTTFTQIPITDGGTAWTFQTTSEIGAVQYKDTLYVATGTKMVKVTYASSTYTAVTVTPYQPTVMEAIYIGTNALADNPSQYIADGTAASLVVTGINPTDRTGSVNKATTMTAYINKPAGVTSVDYKWEYKKSQDVTWTLGRDWTKETGGNNAKSWAFTPDTSTNWDVRVTIRDDANQATTVAYALTGWMVNQTTDNKANTPPPSGGIQHCTRIMLYWDRLIMWGDDQNPYQMYISDLTNPTYFPTTNTISYDTGKLEPITTVVRFRDILVIFTKSTIQTLSGHTPENFSRAIIHDGIGCIAGKSAVVAGGVVLFLSAEGVMQLKPNQFILEVLNVNRIDIPIKSEIAAINNADASAMLYDSQYWLCFPSSKLMFRMYYENNNVWVRDTSTKLNIGKFLVYGADVFELAVDGKLYKQDKTRFDDDGEAFTMTAEAKLLDLGSTFNWKRLKQIFLLARHFTTDTNVNLYIQADSNIILTPDSGTASVINQTATYYGDTVWTSTTTPNFQFYAGTVVGSWILGNSPLGDTEVSVQKATIQGKCRRVKVKITHTEATACEVFGFGLEFREKRPT